MTEGTETRTPVSLSAATWTDPHLQPAAKHPLTVERVITFLFFLGLLAFAGFGAAFWQNWRPWTLGAFLGAGMLFVGGGMVAWGKYLMPRGPFVEDRHELESAPAEVEAMTNALVERGGGQVRRRPFLGTMLAAGLGVFGITAAFPLLRSLGPLPKDTLGTNDWKPGDYLVDWFGKRIQADAIAVGSVVTVFPEGRQSTDRGQAVDQTILIHAEAQAWDGMSNIPQGFVAYSKVCTHAGCPVGLYERELCYLVCPCHQSMFNVLDHALPVFGPAPRPLPQLPIGIDGDGYLYALGGFNQPVGPGYWTRS